MDGLGIANTIAEHAREGSPSLDESAMVPALSKDGQESNTVDAKVPQTRLRADPVKAQKIGDVSPVVADNSEIPNIGPLPALKEISKHYVSASVVGETEVQPRGIGITDNSLPWRGDYFDSSGRSTSNPAGLTHAHPSSIPSQSSDRNHNEKDVSSLTVFFPDRPAKERGDNWTQDAISPHPSLESTRPTSVPNGSSTSLSQRREAPEYPNYPDQSFRALQFQKYPPPYQPYQPHPLRTRSSHPSQSLSYSSIDGSAVKDLPQVISGAKTVGNTPAQSPGLFSPIPHPRKHTMTDSEDGHFSSTPMLHPTHLVAPKETHKLQKDVDPNTGRKLINHYELFEKLGSGQHGTVKLGRDLENSELIAVKIVRRFSKKLRLGKSGDPNDMIKKEVAILKKARHSHVVSLIEVIDDAEFGKVYLVLEYVERGEIVWRKQTEKEIALFEMERTKLELANDVNEEIERTSIENFNKESSSRRREKACLLANQKREAKTIFKAELSQRQGRRSSSDPYWSLEYGGDPESECVPLPPGRADARHWLDLLPDDKVEDSPRSATPMHTPKPRPRSINSEHTPITESSSRPDTPRSFEDSMMGASIEGSSSDIALQSTLNEIIAEQTQWAPEEEDFRYVPCLTLYQALDAFRDTVLGLEYLHFQGIIHRDIKPANLLWTKDYRVKISDFGVSYLGKPIREDDSKEEIPEADAEILDEAIELAKTVGTPAFYAPELCDPQFFEVGKHPERPAITGQIDVWALGVTLYGMIFGRLPFFHHNEFRMYEKIAREEVFIPRLRLKGVEHTDKTPSNSDKRLDDVLEYEEVDDELRDLLKRLLDKEPSKRITLKEVKHHPWVLRGINDHSSWIDETDPSLQSQGKKIEVSTQEVQDAVVGLNLVDRFKAGIQRATSILRGRGSRKRTDSVSKISDSPVSIFSSKTVPAGPNSRDERRTSLRGDEQIFTALRASREGPEHPLSHSVAVSPETKNDSSYFGEEGSTAASDELDIHRPSFSDHTLSTADSMKTIRAPKPASLRDITSSPSTSLPGETFPLNQVVDPMSTSQSSVTGVFVGAAGAGRRLANNIRSRERGIERQSPSYSSRSSSVDTNIDEAHASPSLAVSSAIAAGHVDQPPALREEIVSPRHQHESQAEAFQRAREENIRHRRVNHSQLPTRQTLISLSSDPYPPSPDHEIIFAQQRPDSASESTSGFPISSSSDQIVSGDSTAHSRIPSVVSGASSLSAAVEEGKNLQEPPSMKSISPLTIGRRSGSQPRELSLEAGLNSTPTLSSDAADEDAGYNGEAEQDSDSEDEGLAMA